MREREGGGERGREGEGARECGEAFEQCTVHVSTITRYTR